MQQPKPAHRALPVLAILAVTLIWGLSFVSSKTVLNAGVPPLTMVALRFTLTSAILGAVLRLREPRGRIPAKAALPLVASGLVGVTLYFFFESRGIRLTSASHASLIIATIPVFTVAAESLLHGTRVRWLAALGIALSVAGTFLLVRGSIAAGSLAGDLFMFGACLAWVAYNMLSRDLHRSLSDLAITAWQAIFGTAALVLLALTERRFWVPLTVPVILNLAFLAVFSSAVGNFLYVYSLSRLGPAVVTPFLNLVPVVSAIGGVTLLGEQLDAWQIAGGAVIVAGVVLVRWRLGGPAEAAEEGTEGSSPPG
ncbi:MAG: DMT family transporter [Spirochaetes bacterium]|nr:DMT family transporter [Spirochaetota bacterium]